MARQRKKSKVFSIFKDHFKITFYYKPTMLDDDVYHVIILDNIVRLRIKVVHDALVVDNITPITSAYIPNIYNSIVETLIQQKEFTALIAITGNITVIESACIKAGAPIIEDPRFTCLPARLYDELKTYYKDDASKYGFYLLAVNERPKNAPVNNTHEKSLKPGNLPITEQIESYIKTLFPEISMSFLEEENWGKGKLCIYNGIQFQMILNKPNNSIELKNFYLNEMESYHDLVKLCEAFEKFGDMTTIILCDINDPLLYNICDAKGYQNMTNNLASPLVSINHKYLQSTYGSYKINHNIF